MILACIPRTGTTVTVTACEIMNYKNEVSYCVRQVRGHRNNKIFFATRLSSILGMYWEGENISFQAPFKKKKKKEIS